MLECGFDVVDMIPVRRQNLKFKLPLMELTGEWLASKRHPGQVPIPDLLKQPLWNILIMMLPFK